MSMIKTHTQKAYLIVEVKAPSLMSASLLKEIQPELFKLVDEDGHDKLVLDLSAVRDISSQFIGIILAMHTKVAKKRGKLVLCGLNDKISELMQLTRLDRVIAIKPDAGDAVERDAFL